MRIRRNSGVGGAIGDIGTHAFNLTEYITGDQIAAVAADKHSFVPGRVLDDDVNALLRFRNGGKGVLTISQIAIGEENGLRFRAYGSKGAILWAQENPNYLHVYRHGKPRETLSRGQAGYLSAAATEATRIPWGHPEGFYEAFANIYTGAIDAMRRHIDGTPMAPADYNFPTVHDGVRGMRFIEQGIASANANGAWKEL